ncbi:MAG: hypothetical protein P3B76_11610 [Gemmatimonadota bacterium]|nr:hypothetical protein [Gemmatimonadota bacterium]MDQ8168822.1 hypothetical protein [Gemmatimonadota bacterium]MDQ8173320.1 hypothetical protein [Gemmatimonadota bacterium]
MPPEISGVGAAPRPLPPSSIGPATPAAPAGPVAPSTAVVPVAPVGPRATEVPSSPLGRSGLDLFDVLDTTDILVERPTASAVALDVGLESARASLLRQLPADTLAALDDIWDRAQATEEGWYLRSGALAVLGMPAEAERVSTEGLGQTPASIALRFLQSVVRLVAGDVAGARAAIASAVDIAVQQDVRHPLLLVQHAIVSARHGHRAEAERMLEVAARAFPDHPAVAYGRATLKTIAADRTRTTAREAVGYADDAVPDVVVVSRYDTADESAPVRQPVAESVAQPKAPPVAQPVDAPVADPVAEPVGEPVDDRATESAPQPGAESAAPTDPLDDLVDAVAPRFTSRVAERALARYGADFAMRSTNDAVRDARALIRAFSAGGSMAGACPPDQAHAARVLLTHIVLALTTQDSARPLPGAGVGTDGRGPASAVPPDTGTPLERVVQEWLPLLQAERTSDAERLLRRVGPALPEAQRQLLAACTQLPFEDEAEAVAGAAFTEVPANDGATTDDPVRSPFTGVRDPVVQGATDQGPLIPVRLGLSLLDRATAERERARMPDPATGHLPDVYLGDAPIRYGVDPHADPFLVGGVGSGSAERDGRGWGAARAAGEWQRGAASDGPAMRWGALLCVVAAVFAAATGRGVVAVAAGVAAVWLAGRRGGGAAGRRDREAD